MKETMSYFLLSVTASLKYSWSSIWPSYSTFALKLSSFTLWFQLMLEKDHNMEVPLNQRMERLEVLAREHIQEHKAALKRAYALDVTHSSPPPSRYGTFNEPSVGDQATNRSSPGESSISSSKRRKESWGELLERIFDTDESGNIVLKKSSPH